MEDIWYNKAARFKEDRVVVKLKNPDNSFKTSVIIPTAYYPLNGKCEVFTSENTKRVTDKTVLDIFDKVKYNIGWCYSNSAALTEELVKAGFDAKTYVGWLFTEVTDYPVHHCWVILNGESVLDLGDDFTQMLSGENGKHFEKAESVEEQRELIASFALAARSYPNSIRCSPVGTPTPFLLYVGCPCDAEKGKDMYNRLVRQYPDHECQRNVDKSGYNATQRKMKEAGVMK